MQIKRDQYGNPIPDDLVVLPNVKYLNDIGITTVCNAQWYELKSGQRVKTIVLCASAKEINFLSEDRPQEFGIDLNYAEINAVARNLYRYNEIDGFYHA